MTKTQSHADVLSKYFNFSGKVVIDVGCGTGDFARWMTTQGASVIGIDTPEMIDKAEKIERVGNEKYIIGTGQALPFENNYADLIVYLASFHHIPADEMIHALEQCHKILKSTGTAIFVEPVAQKGSYYEIVRLEADEAEIQAKIYRMLQDANRYGFTMKTEETYFLERSFADFKKLIEVFVDDEVRKADIISKARIVTEQLGRENNVDFESFRYKSICRMNILEKVVSGSI